MYTGNNFQPITTTEAEDFATAEHKIDVWQMQFFSNDYQRWLKYMGLHDKEHTPEDNASNNSI